MKTFEQVVDSTFKPKTYKPLFTENFCAVFYLKKGKVKWLSDRDKRGWIDSKDKLLLTKYETSKAFAKPFYGRDIQQPVINICKKMLEKPEAFEENPTIFLLGLPSRYNYTTVTDKDTGFSLEISSINTPVIGTTYCVDYAKTKVSYPDYFSIDENKLLVATFRVWRKYMDKINKEDSKNSYRKYQEKERQKLMSMYMDQPYD